MGPFLYNQALEQSRILSHRTFCCPKDQLFASSSGFPKTEGSALLSGSLPLVLARRVAITLAEMETALLWAREQGEESVRVLWDER